MEGWDEKEEFGECILFDRTVSKIKKVLSLLSYEMGGACGTYGRQVSCMQNFDERSGGKSRLRIHRRRREYNIKMDLKRSRWGMDWIDVAQDRDR